jgi:hypothetical protein
VAADFDLSVPRVQWVDLNFQPDTCGMYYYRVYCVDQAGNVSPGSNEISAMLPCGCCVGIAGNVDDDPSDAVDIGDLVYLVEYSFSGGPAPACEEEGDVNGDGAIDIGDLVYLVEYSFSGGPEPVACAK